ncbi:hypothetical protein [Pseudonocardia spinosispora]|uniref:hypothetical protein n=1 Tax=Pseudonocardia spinosispora TaxID=103441 RepID=UPI0012EB7A90|nr:hypothetical protein [Pseudonocardia spinosispora]
MRVRVEANLQPRIDPLLAALRNLGAEIEFFDHARFGDLVDGGAPVMVMANAEVNSRLAQGDHRRAPVVVVVDDYLGHQTHVAIDAGATAVINLAIPAERQVHALGALLGLGATSLRAAVADILSDHDAALLARLLSGPETVAAISRRFFCSERTMYRKIRALYARLRVSSRAELRALLAVRPELGELPGEDGSARYEPGMGGLLRTLVDGRAAPFANRLSQAHPHSQQAVH